MRVSPIIPSTMACAMFAMMGCEYGEQSTPYSWTDNAVVGATKPVVVEKTTVRAQQVALFINATETITCADGTTGTATLIAFLSGGKFVDRVPGGPPTNSNGTFIEISSFTNSCTGEAVFFAVGGIDNSVIGPNQTLTSAALIGSGEVATFDEQPVVLPVELDITVAGTGELSASKATTHTRDSLGPGGAFAITVSKGSSRNRSGTASGTITVGGVDFPVEGSLVTLADNAGSTITVTKNP